MSAFYITTAIEYANGEPHLGHAFEKIGADAIARYRRLRGDTAHLLVGTDDHGLKVARAAAAANLTPGEQADRISAIFRRTWDTLGVGYDRFVRTTAPHQRARVRVTVAEERRCVASGAVGGVVRRSVTGDWRVYGTSSRSPQPLSMR